MKKIIEKVIISLAASLCLIGCGVSKKTQQDLIAGASMKATTVIMRQYQLDSMITADNLPIFSQWETSNYTDYETGKVITKKAYIKTYNGKSTVYVVTGTNEPYKTTKRITY